MLFPDKHLKVAESIFGLGGFILSILSDPKNADEIWLEFGTINNTKEFPAYHSFENIILAIDFLYLIGAIKENEEGRFTKCT
jgi:hypothetical protein